MTQRHHRFKVALDQALLLRGSRDFPDRETYQRFLRELFTQLNAGRRIRLQEELAVLRPLPTGRMDVAHKLKIKVSAGSTIRVLHNTYSVPSRLIGETVDVRVGLEHLEVWYAQRCVERLPRLRGQDQHRIHYRHVIDWLVRKPGAFPQYRYRDDLFPTSRFRAAYDALQQRCPGQADREYLELLRLAARETEQGVDQVLGWLLAEDRPIHGPTVAELLQQDQALSLRTEVRIAPVDLAAYDALLSGTPRWETLQ